jgi:hypothetical protein
MKKSLLLGVLAVAILLVGVVAYASADTVVISKNGAGAQTATDTVTVKAAVESKLTLTVVTPGVAVQTVDFGTVDPGSSYGATNVNLTVQSNRSYGITTAIAGQDAAMGLSTTLGNTVVGAPATASQAYVDGYSLNVPWTTGPGNYTATVQYTVTQI